MLNRHVLTRLPLNVAPARRHVSTTIISHRLPRLNETTRHPVRHALRPRVTAPLPPHVLRISAAAFHSTPRRQGGPLIPLFASLFKASTGFEIARMASRVALTFIPFLVFKNIKTRKILQYGENTEEQEAKYRRRIKGRTLGIRLLFLVPFLTLFTTTVASLERTPITGRWRTILLSPEEEDEIAQRLAGPGWFSAVGKLLDDEGSSKLIPPSDWRYQWVQSTLRRLEGSVPTLSNEPESCPNWTEGGCDGCPLPPPADFPLRPRPRASEYLHCFCTNLVKSPESPAVPSTEIPGPPYSLLLVDRPDSTNAFSYGVGADGGSGIVVYSGFIDDVLARHPAHTSAHPTPPRTPPPEPSFLARLFGLRPSPPPPQHPTPTPEQTTELAILLAHEMAHLLLSHHLESLSSMTVMVPGTISLLTDVLRVVIFPITMFFGPFINDAVGQLGKAGSVELSKMSEYCSSVQQEIEADVVSARILAHAGFDARSAVTFWENRDGSDTECARRGPSISPSFAPSSSTSQGTPRSIMGVDHPVSFVRVKSLKDELARWEKERARAIQQARKNDGRGASGSATAT